MDSVRGIEVINSKKKNGPFSGLVICVTGLSKEARKQVKDATERLGGLYSPHLHPQCTHLVVQSSRGPKFEHALKHGAKNGLYIVTLGWFVDSVGRNVRLSESHYSIESIGEHGGSRDKLNGLFSYASAENSCFPMDMLETSKQPGTAIHPQSHSSNKEFRENTESILRGYSMYVDKDVSAELQSKLGEAATSRGATLVDQWLVGCGASHVVCEGHSVHKYLGYSDNLVTPLWILKTAKENHLQRLVHISADIARHVGTVLENVPSLSVEDRNGDGCSNDELISGIKVSHEERQKIANLAKNGVRKRRGRRMQRCQTPIRPITPNTLLDSICWSISAPTSNASIYMESSSVGDASELDISMLGDVKESQDPFLNLSRKLTESEKTAVIFKNHFLTILFPLDRFGEMGPCSRIFFSDTGFTCLQVLEYIYAFYQEKMSNEEVEVAIHTDSRHADRLRSMYSSKDAATCGYVEFKRIDFLGSRTCFEMLKRVTCTEDNNNVYELVVRA